MAESTDSKVKKSLGDFWDEQMGGGLGEESPFPVGSGMDSVTATHVLLRVEVLLNVKDIPFTVIKKGGYESKEDFVDTLSTSLVNHLSSGTTPVVKVGA